MATARTLGPDCILVRRAPGGYRCLAPGEAAALQDFLLGEDAEPDWLFRQCRRITDALDRGELALAQIFGLHIPVADLTDGQLGQLARAAWLPKAHFNPDEPRIPAGQRGGGEWTTGDGSDDMFAPTTDDNESEEASGRDATDFPSGGDDKATGDTDDESAPVRLGADTPLLSYAQVGPQAAAATDQNQAASATVATATVAGEATAGSLLGDIGGTTLTSLGALATSMAGPVAFFGTLLIPLNQSPLSEGSFDGLSDLSYQYNRDTGVLTLIQRDGLVASRRWLWVISTPTGSFATAMTTSSADRCPAAAS
jgi:hypothetical protein